jgi:hypothetical protein
MTNKNEMVNKKQQIIKTSLRGGTPKQPRKTANAGLLRLMARNDD